MNSSLEKLSHQQVKSIEQKPCDRCKAHHSKCDRNAGGCKNCFKRGITCTYLVKRKRRGPKTKVEHFMRHYESLNKINESEVHGIFTDQQDTKDKNIEMISYNSQYMQNANAGILSSPGFNQSLAPDNVILYQTENNTLPLYQNIYNPMLDINCYNLPFPLGLTTVTDAPLITPTTIAATISIEHGISPPYYSLN